MTENSLPEPGEYQAQLISALRGKSKRNGFDQVEVEYRLEPDGKILKSYFVLETSKSLWHLRVWLELLGYQFPAHHGYLVGLLAHIAEEKPRCVVEAISNDGFVYGRLIRRLDSPSEPSEPVSVVPTPVPPQRVVAAPAMQPMPTTATQAAQMVPMSGSVGQAVTVAHTTI